MSATLFHPDHTGRFQLAKGSHPRAPSYAYGAQPWAPKPDRVLAAGLEQQAIEFDQHQPSRLVDLMPIQLQGLVMRNAGKGLDGPLPTQWRCQVGAQPGQVVENVACILPDKV
jgi:hypothetical protein